VPPEVFEHILAALADGTTLQAGRESRYKKGLPFIMLLSLCTA